MGHMIPEINVWDTMRSSPCCDVITRGVHQGSAQGVDIISEKNSRELLIMILQLFEERGENSSEETVTIAVKR